MPHSEEEERKKNKIIGREKLTDSNSSFSTDEKDSTDRDVNPKNDDYDILDAERKIDALFNNDDKLVSEPDVDDEFNSDETQQNLKPEVDIKKSLSSEQKNTAVPSGENSEQTKDQSHSKEEIFDITHTEKKQTNHFQKNSKALNGGKEKKSFSWPKIHLNISSKKEKKEKQNDQSKPKKTGLFNRDNVKDTSASGKTKEKTGKGFSFWKKDKTKQKNSESKKPKPQSDTQNKQIKQKRKKKFSLFSSDKPKKKSVEKEKQRKQVPQEKRQNTSTVNNIAFPQEQKNPTLADTSESCHQQLIDEDVKKVLLITDELLAKLPEEVIEDFASSEDFDLYQKVMNKYNIK